MSFYYQGQDAERFKKRLRQRSWAKKSALRKVVAVEMPGRFQGCKNGIFLGICSFFWKKGLLLIFCDIGVYVVFDLDIWKISQIDYVFVNSFENKTVNPGT